MGQLIPVNSGWKYGEIQFPVPVMLEPEQGFEILVPVKITKINIHRRIKKPKQKWKVFAGSQVKWKSKWIAINLFDLG